MSCFHGHGPGCFYKMLKISKIRSTAKYRWANEEDEEEKQDKEEEN